MNIELQDEKLMLLLSKLALKASVMQSLRHLHMDLLGLIGRRSEISDQKMLEKQIL